MKDVITAYEQKLVDIHSYIWVRFEGEVESPDAESDPLEVSTTEEGTVTKTYAFRRIREDVDGNLISQYIKTTPGRIIYNKTILDALAL